MQPSEKHDNRVTRHGAIELQGKPCSPAAPQPRSPESGVAALITIIVIAAFLLAIGFFIMTKGGTSLFSGQFESQAAKAQFAAEAGIQDALMKLARNKNLTGSYTLSDSDWSVDVAVISSTPMLIFATSTVTQAFATVKRAIRADVAITNYGKITNISKTNQ